MTRALTVRQPWASLIALGIKTIETRSWRTSYRGDLAIHAGQHEPSRDDLLLINGSDSRSSIGLPLGAVVAVTRLVDCIPMVQFLSRHPGHHPDPTTDPAEYEWPFLRINSNKSDASIHRRGEDVVYVPDQLPFGDFAPGRWAWILDSIRPLAVSVPAKGKQGLWTPDADLSARLTEGEPTE